MKNPTIARETRRVVLLVAAAAACVVTPDAHAQTPPFIARVSRTAAGVDGNQSPGRVAVSADGRYVAFDSSASNLVPGDNNDDSDVFVQDATTGVVERVSTTWNGMEGRDDSECPAISADGRYVAFLSRAWNMYPGGANLGYPRNDVYLHDRQTHSTTRVSRAPDGADPDAPSTCPSISADGRRIAFASAAENLVGGDGNGSWDVFLYDADKDKVRLISRRADGRSADDSSWYGQISADGSAVAFVSIARDLDGATLPPPAPPLGPLPRAFVRDIAAGTTEIIDVTPMQPNEQPDGHVYDVAISGDGRVVVFSSSATNLVGDAPPLGRFASNVYVRDRNAATTALASRPDFLLGDCTQGPGTGRCNDGGAWIPSVSSDGRFVSFTSYSQRLMPLTYWFTSQIYVFDRLGERLRRVSLDPYGQETDCLGNSSLSADGSVIAMIGGGGLMPELPYGRHVYRAELQRAADGRRRAPAACPPKPTSCAPAESAVFRLRRSAPGGAHEDRVFWRWRGAAEAAPLPDPVAGARYQLCVYDGVQDAVAMDVGTPSGRACPNGGDACWESHGRHIALRDPNGALSPLTLHGGTGATRILARGKGTLLDAPYLPRPAAKGLTVQLQDTASGRCWGADFPPSAIEKNFAGEPLSATRGDGWLVARLP